MDIGFVGIGMMGKPMAVNLLKAGHNVTVVNRSQGKVQELAGMGATPGASPADAARGAQVVGLCLVGDAVVESVLCGENGVLEGSRAGHDRAGPFDRPSRVRAADGRGVRVAGRYRTWMHRCRGRARWHGAVRLTVMVGGDLPTRSSVRGPRSMRCRRTRGTWGRLAAATSPSWSTTW